jgi:CRISPR-associated protein Cas1
MEKRMRANVDKIILDGHGSFLGVERGCFVVKNKEQETRKYPLFESEVGEVVLKTGNTVSTGALSTMGFWGIDALILTQKGKPVATLRSLDDDSHVATRLAQYEALTNGKGLHITKQVVLGKLVGENLLLQKYGLRQHDLMSVKSQIEEIGTENLKVLRRKLLAIEGRCSEHYFKQIIGLLPESMRKTNKRRTFRAYDGMNNTFNLVYTLLKWKVHRALLAAKLEPYLGFMHSEQPYKPSLICDIMELYRHLADDFLIQYCKDVQRKDFVVKTEKYRPNKFGKREYLSDSKTDDLTKRFYAYLDWKVRIPRIGHGNRSSIETLINEETSLLAKYIRNEQKSWIPRIGITT